MGVLAPGCVNILGDYLWKESNMDTPQTGRQYCFKTNLEDSSVITTKSRGVQHNIWPPKRGPIISLVAVNVLLVGDILFHLAGG